VIRPVTTSCEIGLSCLRLFEQCNLACVVELVLDDPAERIEEIVIAFGLALNSFLQP